MNIAIIDADLTNNIKHHRFPNLACMKISSYYKQKGDSVILKLDYNELEKYDKVFISKVFTNTFVPNEILQLPNVEYGGTGFYFDKAPKLPYEIEHIMPDYELYNDWVNERVSSGDSRKNFTNYLDVSVGFLARGCFRKCHFCVNRNYDKATKVGNVNEFLNQSRKYIILLDDNVLACEKWKEIFKELQATNKPFQFNQGLDIRLLTKEKCDIIFKDSKYYNNYIFAFDNIEDRDIIEKKLQMIKENYPTKPQNTTFYIFCGLENPSRKYVNFEKEDIEELFQRIEIVTRYGCVPYVMRHENFNNLKYKSLYTVIASWCNQPSFFRKMTFRTFCILRGIDTRYYQKYKDNPNKYIEDGFNKGISWRVLEEFEKEYPNIAKEYFDIKYLDR